MKKKGISLITLVITIVVVIILAAAVIIALGQNNPISLAKSARDKQSINNIEEEFDLYISSQYARSTGTFDRNSLTVPEEGEGTNGIKIEDVVPSIKGTEFEGNVSITNGKLEINLPNRAIEGYIVKDNKKTINGLAPNYDNPIIPVGFKAVDTKDAVWNTDNGFRNGLVIEDADGNQFVWIPVYNLGGTDKIEYARWTGGPPNNANTVESNQVIDDTVPLTGDGDKELDQITTYKGFYIARYEASLPSDLIDPNKIMADNNVVLIPSTTTYYKPESKLYGFVWNNINYINAKAVAEHAYVTSSVQSGLVTGRQWDTMLKFIEQSKGDDGTGNGVNTNSTNWGNYKNTTGFSFSTGYYKKDVDYNSSSYVNAASIPVNKTSDSNVLMQTGMFGNITNEHPKNLYDVAGNVWEWTSEKVSSVGGSKTAVGNIIIRGGSFSSRGYASTASRFGNNYAEGWFHNVGFRLVLYVL